MGRSKAKIEASENGLSISGNAEEIQDTLEAATRNKTIVIKGASLKDAMFASYQYDHNLPGNTTNKCSVKSEVPVHSDMVDAFNDLNIHLAVICEEVESKGYSLGELQAIKKTADKIEKFTVVSFKLEGNEDDPQVTLIGTKTLKSGDLLKLETPKTKLDASYPYAHELSATLDWCVKEIEEYMNGKRAPEQQLDMFEQNEEEQN